MVQKVPPGLAVIAAWPNLFIERLKQAGSEVILLGPDSSGDPGAAGIDTAERSAQVPDNYAGYIRTNKIETIGPLARRRFK